jgi:hypothetical protein
LFDYLRAIEELKESDDSGSGSTTGRGQAAPIEGHEQKKTPKMCFFEYNWAVVIWQFRIGDRFDVKGKGKGKGKRKGKAIRQQV